MRLFLSSENLGKHPEVFLKMVGPGKLGVTENAKDDWTEPDRQTKVQEHIDQLKRQGFDPEEIDLRNYFGKPDELKNNMNELSGLFVFGGNTFILRRAMAASGLDKILQDLVPSGKLVYGGSSAGSCVAAKSLHGIEYGDRPQPDVVPDDYPIKKTIWEGLNLVPFMIVPHCESDWFGKEARKSIKYMKEHKIPHKSLTDGQVVVVDGDKTEVLK